MTKRTALGLGLVAISLLAACQTDPRVTSVAPAFQSAESQVLRSQINGATLGWPSGDSPTQKNCRDEATFAKDGTFRWLTRCTSISDGANPLFQSSEGGYVISLDGSWAVRDEQICYNVFRINGAQASEAAREATCWAAKATGEQVIISNGGPPITAIVVRRN